MAFKCATLLLVCAYASTSMAMPPCVCTREFRPVCGSNGIMYSNRCEFKCAQTKKIELTESAMDRCKNNEGCMCPFVYLPVCGSNGKTYPNECALRCDKRGDESLEARHAGVCGGDEKTGQMNSACVCTREKRPQCGSDGVTYANPCMLRCAQQEKNVSLDHAGPCDNSGKVEEPVCACTRNLMPVCGANGVTYNNPCLLKCAGQQMVRDGPCSDDV